MIRFFIISKKINIELTEVLLFPGSMKEMIFSVIFCNNFIPQPGMKQKLEQISQNLDWVERMDVTVDKDQEEQEETVKTAATPTPNSEKSIHNDFQREMKL